MTFAIPDFLQPTGRNCPKHSNVPTYMINGHEKCGACSLYRANKKRDDDLKDYFKKNGDVLGNYNKEKDQARIKRQERKDFKKAAAGDRS